MNSMLLVGDRLRPLVERLEAEEGVDLTLEWVSTVGEAFSKLALVSFAYVVVCRPLGPHDPRTLLRRFMTVQSAAPYVVIVEFEGGPEIDGEDSGIGGTEPAVDGGEPVIEDGGPAVDGDKPVIEDRKLAVDSKTPGVDSKTPGVDGETPGVDGETPEVESDTPGVDETVASMPNVEFVRATSIDRVVSRIQSLLFDHSFDQLVRRERLLQTTLFDATHHLFSETDRNRLESLLCRTLVETGLYTVCWMSRYNEATDTLVPSAAAGIDPSALAHRPIPLGAKSEPEPTAFVTGTTDGARTIAVTLAQNGTFYGLLSVVSTDDVSSTERELLETFGGCLAADIEQRERKRMDSLVFENFCRAITHEFRTHLQIANAYIEGEGAAEQEDGSTAKVGASLERMSRLTDQIRALGNAPLDAGSLMERELETTAKTAWEHVQNAHGELDVVESAAVTGNHLLLEVLFENLFRNSLEHGTQATIRVGVLEDGFFVGDDGPGIPPDIQDEVFDWGFTTTDSGMGIGLALVNHIVAAHGWEIAISDEQDEGVRFDITGVALESDED